MQELLQKYLRAFKRLRVDRSHGTPAPHKAILLISVLQSFQSGMITSRKIYLTPELVALFKTNWNLLVTSEHHCRISYPFYHLKSDKFWTLIPRTGFSNIDLIGSLVKSLSNLNAAIECAVIEEDLYALMTDKNCNDILTQLMLNEYFNSSRNNFNPSGSGQKQLFNDLENKILNEPSEEYRQEIKKLLEQKNEEEIFLRGSLFKREIPKIYNNTCCISGMKIDATTNVSMIDACHIIPFSTSYDDTVTNGIALCPNLHRAFDRGLIGVDDNYTVIVSSTFVENNSEYNIKKFAGKEIQLPNNDKYYPLKNNFEWHRLNVFK